MLRNFARHGTPRPSGFTLVELLVVVAVLGLLMAVLVPAVFHSRETAHGAVCQNNLRDIGLALQQYHNDNGHFPVGGTEWRFRPNLKSRRQLAWNVFLLPYLDQQDLYRKLDLSSAFDSPRNAQAAATVLSVFLCPSATRTQTLVDGRGPSDYGGIFGERITSPNNPPKGTMLYDKKIRKEDVHDGLAQTLIVSEDTAWQHGQWINGLNVFDQAYRINQAPPFENDIRSNHTGGAYGLFCDGRAHFLHESMDPKTLAAICTRAGKERIEDPDWLKP